MAVVLFYRSLMFSSLQATTTNACRGLPQALCRCRPDPVMQQAVQSHLGHVVWCLDGIAWLDLKFFGTFTRLVCKDVQPLQSVKLID
jgi:hypothetical protein